MKRLACLLAPTLLSLAAATATAQSEDEGLEEIVVTGRRELGAVIGDITPELQLSAEEIRALGVSSVAELLTALGPQLGSNRGRGSGRPIVLINGVRTSGFAEVRDLPTEAILRTDILPEEVALKYGYRADQRVVNFVLRPRFRAYTAEFGARGSTDGGREGADLNGGWLRIQRDDRLQVDLKARRDEGLLESERNVVGASGVPNADARFRSLSPTSEQLTANVVLAKPLGEGFAMIVNASLDDGQRDSLLGLRNLPTGISTLRRSVETQDARLAAILQGTLPGWRWSATAGLERGDSRTSTSGEGLTGRSRTDTADLDFVINGSVFDLPAGAASLTAKLALGTRGIDSASQRGVQNVRSDLSRDQREAQLNLDLPLLRSEAGPGGFGNLSLNLNAAIEDVSDVGSLDTTGYGLIWSRGRQFRVIATVTDEQGAPSMQQLGGAVITTPFVRTFDLLRGETVDITRIDGGNTALSPDRRKVFKLGLGSRPFEEVDFDINADWTRSETRDLVSSLPIASPELEAVFRDRFPRDPSGRLLAIDARPVNLAGRERDDLRVSFNLSRPWGPQPESPMPRQRGAGGSDARAPSGGAPSGGAPSSGPPADDAARRARMAQMGERFLAFARRGSVQFSLAYTQRLNDELTIAPGLPSLDLLAGDTLFDTAGVSRHELELAVGANREGYGARMTTQWRAGSRVARAAAGNTRNDLEFSALTTVNLRLFADLGLVEWARPYPVLRGARVSIVVGNLFNERQDVRTLDGSTPVNYQADLLDPLGRNVRLTFRKLFFPGMPPPGGRTG